MSFRESVPQMAVIESSSPKPKNNTSTHIALDLALPFLQRDTTDISRHLNDAIFRFDTFGGLKYDPNVVNAARRFFPTLHVKELQLHSSYDFHRIINQATKFAREETNKHNDDVVLIFTTTNNSILLAFDYLRNLWVVFDSFTRPSHQNPAILFARSGPTVKYLQDAFSRPPKDPKHSRIFVITLNRSREEVRRRPTALPHEIGVVPHHHGHGHGHGHARHGGDQRIRPFTPAAVGSSSSKQSPSTRILRGPRKPSPKTPDSFDPALIELLRLRIIRRRQEEMGNFERLLQGQLAEMGLMTRFQSSSSAAPVPAPAPAPAPALAPLIVPEPALPEGFECSICGWDYPIDYIFLTSECEHSCCRDCASFYIMIMISTSCVVRCFQHGCKSHLTQIDAQIVLNDEDMAKYQKAEERAACQQKDTFPCPKPDCPGFAVVETPDVLFECEVCRSTKCVRCDVTPFHHGSTCEQFMDWKRNNDNGDNSFAEYLRGEKHGKCPKCTVIVSKTEGCNHMECTCGAHFCYLCNIELDPRNAYSHFKANGGSNCDLYEVPDEDY